jgi:TonB-linked SusC/RagA family outer membrane protein
MKTTQNLFAGVFNSLLTKASKMMPLVIMLFMGFAANAQNRTVTGKVVDENGVPLEAASISAAGVSTKTKADGSFSISIPNTAKNITISYVGYIRKVIKINSDNSINVSLAIVKKEEEEVIVTGIKTVKKNEYAGASSSISSKTIKDKPVGSFDQLLQGQIAGLLAVTGSGQPGTAAGITIRGTGSVAGSSNPLYIIDGIPVEAGVFQAINPNDFESIDVLKDAAAAALYGSRGSSGVIVVTTKRGTSGKLKVGYTGQFGFKSKPQIAYEPMSTSELLKTQEDYGKVLNTAGNANIPGWYYSKLNPRYSSLTTAQKTQADFLLDSISKINTNWDSYVFRQGTFSNHQINISGGTGKTRLYSSLELYNEEGTTRRTDMKRISWRNNVDYADDKVSVALSSSLSYVKRSFQQSTVTNSLGNPFLIKNLTSPYSLTYKPDGSYATGVGSAYAGANALELTDLDQNYNNQVKVVLGLTSSYKVTKNITAALTTGIDFRETQATNYGSKLAFGRVNSTTFTGRAGFIVESLGRILQATVRPSLTYINTFANKHKVDVGVYGEYIQQNTKSLSLTGYGIDPRTPGTPAAITQGDGVNQLFANVSGGKSSNALSSALAIASYTFNEKYTLTGSYRSDGSSKLPVQNRWQDFYSVGAIWNMKKEKFLENSNLVNSLRLRASYGGSGNSDNFPFGDFGYLATYAANGNYSGLTTLFPNNIGNPDLKWERTFVLNTGVDFSLVNSRLYGSVDVYNKETKDLFVLKPLTAEGGGGVIYVNAGKLSNKGVEVDLSYDIVKNRNITWTINGKVGYNKNKVLSLGGQESFTAGTALIKEGLPLGSHNQVKWAGVDAATGSPLYYKKDGSITNAFPADDAVQEFGTYEAPWKGGFGTSLRYGAFDFSVLLSWQKGGTKFDNLEYFVENPGGFLSAGYNQSRSLNFWKKPGDLASTPSPLFSTNFSSKLIHDASFMRLRDVTLNYTLPQSISKKLKFVSKASFFVQGQNLFIWTTWKGMDPEAGNVNINLSEFPNPKALTFGFNVTF